MLLKATRTAVLTVAALDILYAQEEGCCTYCCGMCWVLHDMNKKGDLDQVIQGAPLDFFDTSEWWDDRRKMVNRAWLTAKWLTPCNHGITDEEEEIEVE